ncbi:7805_t:CDS:2, partial [Cetraspora pellucida]
NIKFFDYTLFNDIELIGEGGHGKVYRATLKDNDITVALKSFKSNNVTIKEIINEVIGLFSFEESRKENRIFKFNKKSDVYSVGVLLWELTSGCPPFKDVVELYQLPSLLEDIKKGVRENHIEGTPPTYIKIYSDCWQRDPDSRPDIQQVFLDLKNLITNVKQDTNLIVQDSSTLKAHGSTQLFDQ